MLKISLWAHCGHTGIIKLMKKLLGILVLGLLFSGNSYADSDLPSCKGQDISKYSNCFGKYINKKYELDGEEYLADYEGEFGELPGLADGYGKSRNHSFSSTENKDYFEEYEGNFKNDYYHGQGTLITEYETYTGEFYEGDLQGKGVLKVKWSNSYREEERTYEGIFKQSEIKRGTLTFYGKKPVYFDENFLGKKLKQIYEGHFKDYEMHGKGKLIGLGDYGFIYEGNFEFDKFYGMGSFTDKNKGWIFKGNFHAGEIEDGSLTESDGQKYVGKFSDWNEIEGQGKFYDSKGMKQNYFNENKIKAQKKLLIKEDAAKYEEQMKQAQLLYNKVITCYKYMTHLPLKDYVGMLKRLKSQRDYVELIFRSEQILFAYPECS